MLIFLLGMMGSGKSTVGQILASRLSVPLYDTDLLIEKRAGEAISTIFATKGESAFRQLELEVMQQWAMDEGVVAIGGGLPCHSGLMDHILRLGITIYLSCPPDVLAARLHTATNRPLLSKELTERGERLSELLRYRSGIYERAHWTVDASAAPASVADCILQRLQEGGHLTGLP